MNRYPRLTIRHNHGVLVLADATVERGVAQGTVVRGHTTNRLLWATSTQHEAPGTQSSYPLYGRAPRERHLGYAADGQWCETPTPGDFVVNCEFF